MREPAAEAQCHALLLLLPAHPRTCKADDGKDPPQECKRKEGPQSSLDRAGAFCHVFRWCVSMRMVSCETRARERRLQQNNLFVNGFLRSDAMTGATSCGQTRRQVRGSSIRGKYAA